MALDEQLRQLADQVPPPPPGDATTAFRRGRRRRRIRHVAGVAAAASVVAVLGVAVTSLFGGPTMPDIADQPPAATDRGDGEARSEDGPVSIGPPELTLSAEDPFPWVVVVSPGEDGRWCATAVHGTTLGGDATGQPCEQLLTPEQAGDPDGFGTGRSEVEATPFGEPVRGLSWGFAPPGTDEVFVLFSDGRREQAASAAGGSVPASLWAIGYEGVEVQAVEARRGGEVIAAPQPPAEERSVAEDEVRLVDSQAALPREPANEFADIATTAADATDVWQRFRLTGRPPQVDFDTAALLFVAFGESGSCPARFDGMSVEGDRVHVAIGAEGGPLCTDDYNPRTLVLEVTRDALADGGFEVTVRGRTFVLSSEPLPEPPLYHDAIVGRLTSESPQLGFDAQPRSVPGGGRPELVLTNEGDVTASTGSWPMTLYRWDDQRWLPADDQGWEEPSSSIEEVLVTVEPGDQQVIASVDTEDLDPGWYGVYAKLQLGGPGYGAVEVHESFEVTAQ